MDLSELPPAAGEVSRPQPPPPAAPVVRAGAPVAAASVLKKRKRAGTHVVVAGAAPAAAAVAVPAKASTAAVPRARPKMGATRTKAGDGAKQSGDGGKRKQTVKQSGLPPPAPPAEIDASQDNDVGGANMFVEMPPRSRNTGTARDALVGLCDLQFSIELIENEGRSKWVKGEMYAWMDIANALGHMDA